MTQDRWMTFDCYGTLLDWQGGFRRILGPVAGSRVEELVEALHAAEPDVQRELARAGYKEILRETLRRAAAHVGIDLADGDEDLLVAGWGTLEPFADTPGALLALKEQGWKLGILTNCDIDLFESTRAALGAEIDLVVTAEEVRSYKPALAHFERFEARSGADRRRWVHAAVSWWHDMLPARTLGLRRVWVDREDSGHDPSVVTARIRDMASLPALAIDLLAAS